MPFTKLFNAICVEKETSTIVPELPLFEHRNPQDNENFERILNERIWDIETVKKLSSSGIEEPYRAPIWSFLLGVSPTDRSQENKFQQKRQWQYHQICQELWDPEKGEARYLSESRFDQFHTKILQILSISTEKLPSDYSGLLRMCDHIGSDVRRTSASLGFVRTVWVQSMTQRVLTVWTWVAPQIGYSQGMSELVVPFLVVNILHSLTSIDQFPLIIYTVSEFSELSEPEAHEVLSRLSQEALENIEANIFWQVHRFFYIIRSYFGTDHIAIQYEMGRMEKIVRMIHFQLYAHLDNHGIHIRDFAYRWFRCLLVRELPLKNSVRLWDTYISADDFPVFHTFVCATLLCSFASQICEMESKEEILLFLKSLPREHMNIAWIDKLILQSFINRHMYNRR